MLYWVFHHKNHDHSLLRMGLLMLQNVSTKKMFKHPLEENFILLDIFHDYGVVFISYNMSWY